MPSTPKHRQPRLTVTHGYYLAGNVTSRTYLDGTVETLTYAYDGLGSVVNLTSSTGATWWTYSYLPYGGTRTATKNSNRAPDNLLRFAGGYLDPTSLYHFGARQYDAGTGRFISTDPVGPSIADPYVAAYLYANDNPVRYTDPSGRDVVGICVTGEINLPFLTFGEFAFCIVASDSGQLGVAGVGAVGLGWVTTRQIGRAHV